MNPLLERIDRFLPRNLQVKLSLLVTTLLALLVSLIGVLFSDFTGNILKRQFGGKALAVAQSVALNPVVREGLEARDPLRVQVLAEQVRQATTAEYVVIGDRAGIRYSHPEPEKVGKPFVGGDYERAVEQGESYVSQAVGTLGPALRGFVPVRGKGGAVVGFVAVGYLLRDIEAAVRSQTREIFGYVGVVLFFGVFGAMAIARGLKAAIFGLEPHEIAALYQERNAIIGAIREGVVAVDGAGRLTLVNQAACRYLGQPASLDLRGRRLAELCACGELEQALARGEQAFDREVPLAGRTMVVNILPLAGPGAGGAVASFRPRDELDRLTRELSHMQEYSELLRAQTHEYSNKLHTIAGLIQIGAHHEALDLIMTEASGYQELIRTLARAVPDPVVAGIILGKFNRARELKIAFSVNPDSSFSDLPEHLEREHLVTILGNLLDNAFEAVREAGNGGSGVRLLLTDLGSDLIIEVDDAGRGVAPEMADRLFEKGATTHGGLGRGLGLNLVRRALDALGGEVTFAKSELGGALFTVIIPKTPLRPEGAAGAGRTGSEGGAA